MNFKPELPERAHWNNAGTWFFWTLLSLAIPLLGSALLFAVLKEGGRSTDLVSQGQLGLYAAAMISTPAYLCSIDREVTRLRWRGPLLFFSIIVLAGASLIYGGVQAADILSDRSEQRIEINEGLTLVLTVAALVISLVVSFFAAVADGERQQRSFAQVVERQQRSLASDFRELGQ